MLTLRIIAGIVTVLAFVPLLWWAEDLKYKHTARWPEVLGVWLCLFVWLFIGLFAVEGI